MTTSGGAKGCNLEGQPSATMAAGHGLGARHRQPRRGPANERRWTHCGRVVKRRAACVACVALCTCSSPRAQEDDRLHSTAEIVDLDTSDYVVLDRIEPAPANTLAGTTFGGPARGGSGTPAAEAPSAAPCRRRARRRCGARTSRCSRPRVIAPYLPAFAAISSPSPVRLATGPSGTALASAAARAAISLGTKSTC
jgi:hypothetical protein